MNTDIRQRKPNTSPPPSFKRPRPNTETSDDSPTTISTLDILRILLTLLLVTAASSYYLTSGTSLIFNLPRPWFTSPTQIKHYLRGPVNLTPSELALYNGTDPSLPIYLAVNGTIFDVSAGRQTYGPGGSYHAFAGYDATRAFVTGCFMEDRTGDLRGAEEVYLPVEDEEEVIGNSERKIRAERERRLARKKVREEVEKWERFYGGSTKYFRVGSVVGSEREASGPVPTLCVAAQKGRPKRKNMNVNRAKEAPGKPVQ